jgi:hypothetical protein
LAYHDEDTDDLYDGDEGDMDDDDDANDFAMSYYLNSTHENISPVEEEGKGSLLSYQQQQREEEEKQPQQDSSTKAATTLSNNQHNEITDNTEESTMDNRQHQELETVALFPKSVESTSGLLTRPIPQRSTSLPVQNKENPSTEGNNHSTNKSAATATTKQQRSTMLEKGQTRRQRDEAVRNAMVHVQKIDVSNIDLAGKTAKEGKHII